MASKKVVADGETKDEVDEVTIIKTKSEDDDGNGILPRHSSVILDSDVGKEIELFLKQELISEQDVSVDGPRQKRNTNEKNLNPTDTGNGKVAGLVSSEIKQRVQIESNVLEKRNDQTEILNKKRLRDSDVEDEKEIDYDLGIESGTNYLETTEHSDNVSGSTNKTDQNVFDIKAKDVGSEAKSTETTSVRTYQINRDLSPLWDSYILSVKGIPPKESGRLKALLNDVLGTNRHRVRPRQKGDTVVYVHFITQEDMKIAKETLTARSVADYKLTVTVQSADGRKSKSDGDNEGPASKKMKHDPTVQFYEEDYDKQIEFKVKDITARLQCLARDILKMYPTYCRLVHHRRLQHEGAICAVDKLKDCPASKRVAFRCWFAVGASEETGQLALGIYQGGGCVRKLSLVKHNYPDHVVKAAEVFEQFLLAEESRKICRKLLIYTNCAQDLMLLVFVHDTSHVNQVGNEMKEFFMSGDGAKCRVTSIHVKVMKSNHNIKDEDMQLVVSGPCLQETVAGLELQLPPGKNLWNTVHGAEMLCQALEELLAPSEKTTVLDIGCGIGLLGLYLAKKAGEVLGVDTSVAVDVAMKNASLNGATHCTYFAGDADVMIPVLAKKMKHDSVCAVVTCSLNSTCRSGRAMEELRKIRHLDRLVLVEGKTMSSGAILALSKPSSDKKMGNPFFPLKVVPVDSLPNSRGYVLLVLMERVSNDDIQKFGIDSKSVAADSEPRAKGSASRKPYESGSKVRLQQGNRRWLSNTQWDRQALSKQRYEAAAGTVQSRLLQNTASYEHLQTADVLRARVGTASSLTDVERRRRMEEDYRRQMMEEEQWEWLAKGEQRRLREEMGLRQVQEEDWVRWIQDERLRRIQEEEWRRQIEEEEERMRRIHGVEHMRRMQEEEYRRIEEEEWRRQVYEAEWRREMQEGQRRVKEEEWRRQIQEDEQRRVKEEEWRRKMQREGQKGPVLSEKVLEEEQLRRPLKEERERELVRGSVVRSRNDLVQDLIADTLRAAAIPQLSADTAQKVQHLLAEAIRTAGAMVQGERPGGGQNREVGGMSREDTTVSRFGTSNKEMLPSRRVEGEDLRYMREVESAYSHNHDMSGGAAGRYGSERSDLKAQCQAVGTESSEKLPSLLDVNVNHPQFSVESSYSAQRSDNRGGDANRWQGMASLVREKFDSQAECDRATDRSFNLGNQARDAVRRDGKTTFSSITEDSADIYMRRSNLDQERQRCSATQGRMDVQGAGIRNAIGRPEHSRKDHHPVSGHPYTRPWLDSN